MAPPCNDLSLQRAFDKNGKFSEQDAANRPGLNGPTGKVFRKCLQIYKWVVQHNPEVEYFLENVMFEDLHNDWNEVCDVVGQPLIITSSDVAMTRRRRAYFTNIELPESFGIWDVDAVCDGFEPIDGDECMTPGRRLAKFKVADNDNWQNRPIGASWGPPVNQPKSKTSRPVEVIDIETGGTVDLQVPEAARLMGWPAHAFEIPGVTPLESMVGIGGGWCNMTTAMILRFSKYATVSLPTSRSVIAAGIKAIGGRDWTGISLIPGNHQASTGDVRSVRHVRCEDPDQEMDISEITQRVTETGIGRINAGMRKTTEIEINRLKELVKDVPEDEMHAAPEESDLDGASVTSTESDERDVEVDEQTPASLSDDLYSSETEPQTEEISDGPDGDEVPIEVIDMCQQKLIEEHGWSQEDAAHWATEQEHILAAVQKERNHQQDTSSGEDAGTEPYVLLMIDGGAFWDMTSVVECVRDGRLSLTCVIVAKRRRRGCSVVGR